jgi:hypothetical protein
MTTIQEKLLKNRQTYSQKVEDIRADWELSDAAKDQRLQEAYSEAISTHNTLVDQLRHNFWKAYEDGRREMFKAPTVGTDKAQNTMLYRDALERTRGVGGPELQEMLEEATLTGDRALARAVLLHGYSHPHEAVQRAVVESYFAHAEKSELDQWTRMMDAAESLNRLNELGVELTTGVAAPEDPSRSRQSVGTGMAAGMAAFEQAVASGDITEPSGMETSTPAQEAS